MSNILFWIFRILPSIIIILLSSPIISWVPQSKYPPSRMGFHAFSLESFCYTSCSDASFLFTRSFLCLCFLEVTWLVISVVFSPSSFLHALLIAYSRTGCPGVYISWIERAAASWATRTLSWMAVDFVKVFFFKPICRRQLMDNEEWIINHGWLSYRT